MKVRSLCLLAFASLLPACTAQRPAPPRPALGSRAEIEIHAPIERVRISLITQQTGEGSALLASASENRLSFVTQMSRPDTEVWYDLKPTGAPYFRTTYLLRGEARETHVSSSCEIVRDYGTVFAHARPIDTASIRETQRRDLLRLRAITEKP